MKLSKGVLILASILVVEDEKAINDLVCSNLTMMGHSCFSALCGREGVAMAREHSFDLLILDVGSSKAMILAPSLRKRPSGTTKVPSKRLLIRMICQIFPFFH